MVIPLNDSIVSRHSVLFFVCKVRVHRVHVLTFTFFHTDVGTDVDEMEFLQYATTLSIHTITDYEFGHMMFEMFSVPRESIVHFQKSTPAPKDYNGANRVMQSLTERRKQMKEHEKTKVWSDLSRSTYSRTTGSGSTHDYGGASARLKLRMRR